jgi:nitrous oxidase accessory protein
VLAAVDLRNTRGAAVLGCRISGVDVSLGRRGDAIRVWESDDVVIAGNRVDTMRDVIVWYSDGVTIAGNSVSESRYGTHLMYAHGVKIAGNRYAHDVVGVFTMYSRGVAVIGNTVADSDGPAGMGLGFKEADEVEVARNRIGSSTTGIFVDTSPLRPDGYARFEANLVAYNGVGARLHGPAGDNLVFRGNSFWENDAAAAVDGGGGVGEARFEGNGWTEYAGYDLDEDGVGDVPFELRRASTDLRKRDPSVAFFSGTLAMDLLDAIASAFPLFAARVTLRDPAPRFDPAPP